MKLCTWKWIAVLALTASGFPATALAQRQSGGEMLLDVSRSMSSNDRENIRWDGMLTLVQLLALSGENGLGVRHFTERDEVQIARRRIDAVSAEIFAMLARSRVRSGGGTDLVPALSHAVQELARQPGTRYVVVVSDGRFGNDKEIGEVAQQFIRAGGRLFFVCLGPQGLDRANSALVAACTRSGGANYTILTRPAPRKEEVLAVFLDIYARISPPTIALLTDSEGHFALDRSHRSFIALDPRGTKVQVVDPNGRQVPRIQTQPFPARNVSFQQWNVFVCERPPRSAIETNWESRNWRVVNQFDGRPVRNAHVYVHGDVSIDKVPPDGFTGRSTSDAAIEVTLRANALGAWSDVADAEDFLKEAQADVRVVDARNQVVERAALEYQPGGRFVGEVQGLQPEGAYTVEIDVRHQSSPEGLLARAVGIPLRITPPFAEAEVWVRQAGGAPEQVRYHPTNGQQTTEVPMGAQMQVRLKVLDARPGGTGSSLRQSAAIRSATLTLQLPDGREVEHPLVASRADGREHWRTEPWIDLADFGTLQGSIRLRGEIRSEAAAQVGMGVDPIRIERLEDTVAMPVLAVRGGQIQLQWAEAMPELSGCDQLLYFAGRLAIQDTPEQRRAMVSDLKQDGLRVEVRGPAGSFNTREHGELFEEFRVEDTADGVAFSGFFAGIRRPGEYAIEPRLTVGGQPVTPLNSRRLVAVGDSVLDLALVQSTASVTNRVPIQTCEADARTTLLFADRDLTAEIALAEEADVNLNQVPLVVELVSDGERHRLEVEPGEGGVRTRAVQLSQGRHELNIDLRLGPASIIRRAVRVDAAPAPPLPPAKLIAQWTRPPEAYGRDQVLGWSGQFRIQGEPAQVAQIRQALVTGGVHFEVECGDERSDSRRQSALFQVQPCVVEGPEISFGGMYFGPKTPGVCTVRILPPGDTGADMNLVNMAQELSIGEDSLDVRLWAGRGEQNRRLVSLGGDDPVTVFGDELLSLEIEPADRWGFRGVTGYDSPPRIEIVPNVEPPLVVAVDGLNITSEPFSLAPGVYELRLDARIKPGSHVRQRLAFEVVEPGLPTVAWTTSPKAQYWRYESATLGARVTFPVGQVQDWAEWMRGRELVAVLRRPGQTGPGVTVPFGNVVQQGFAGSAQLPTEDLGDHEITVELRQGDRVLAATAPLQCSVMPLAEFEMVQGDRLVLDTRSGRIRPFEPGQESQVVLRVPDGSRQIADARVLVRRNGRAVAEVPLAGPDGFQPATLPALEASDYEIEFAAQVLPPRPEENDAYPGPGDSGTAARLDAGGDGAPAADADAGGVWLRHIVPTQCAVDVPRRIRQWLALFGLPVFGGLAALLAGTWWFWPGIREWRTPLGRRLPLLTGTLRWVPLPGVAAPAGRPTTITLDGQTPLTYRMLHRGKPKRVLTLGKGGEYPLLPKSARLGWDEARVALQIVGEALRPALAITYQRQHQGGHLLVKRDAGIPLTEREQIILERRPRMDLTIAKDIHTIVKVQLNLAGTGTKAGNGHTDDTRSKETP